MDVESMESVGHYTIGVLFAFFFFVLCTHYTGHYSIPFTM